jgi:DNA-binding protein Fis
MKRRPRQKGARVSHELALAYLGVLSRGEIRLARVVDEHIKRVLGATDNNLSLAAVLLGMHRRSLQRYVRRKRLRPHRRPLTKG